MWDTYVGRKVVCLRENWVCNAGESVPQEGLIYTIRDAELGAPPHDDRPFLRFYESMNPALPYRDRVVECNFDSRDFRPVDERKTDISVLEQLLVFTMQREDA